MVEKSIAIFYFSCIRFDYALLQRPQQLFNAWKEREQVPFDFFYVDFPDYFVKTLDSFGNFMKRRYRSLTAKAHPTQARKKKDERNIVTGWIYLPLEQIGSGLLERLSVFDKINRPIINGFFMHRLFSAGEASFDTKLRWRLLRILLGNRSSRGKSVTRAKRKARTCLHNMPIGIITGNCEFIQQVMPSVFCTVVSSHVNEKRRHTRGWLRHVSWA